MAQTAKFFYTENKDFQVLELPYAGEALSMVVFLPRSPDMLNRALAVLRPRSGDMLNRFEESLTLEKLLETMTALRSTTVRVFLPRFKLTGLYPLKNTLSALGIRDAFSAQRVDFTGVSMEKPRLFIAQVLQKTFAEVNEQGTEAAAVTAIMMGQSRARGGVKPPPIPVFRADHPFMFLIRHRPSNCILFVGRVTNPPAAGKN